MLNQTDSSQEFTCDHFQIDAGLTQLYCHPLYLQILVSGCEQKIYRFYKNSLNISLPKIIIQPVFKKTEMLRIFIKSYTPGQFEYLDTNVHIDIHDPSSQDIKSEIFPYTLKDGKCESEKGVGITQKFVEDGEGNFFSLSEVIIYKHFDPSCSYKVYLYSYVGDFTEVQAECHIYHHKEGYLEDIQPEKACKFLLAKTDPSLEPKKLWKICEITGSAKHNYVRLNELVDGKESGLIDGLNEFE